MDEKTNLGASSYGALTEKERETLFPFIRDVGVYLLREYSLEAAKKEGYGLELCVGSIISGLEKLTVTSFSGENDEITCDILERLFSEYESNPEFARIINYLYTGSLIEDFAEADVLDTLGYELFLEILNKFSKSANTLLI